MKSIPVAILALVSVLVIAALVGGYFIFRSGAPGASRALRVRAWLRDPQSHPEWSLSAGERCGQAPFLMPTNGLVGFLWGDSFRLGHHHQGLDIFGGEPMNVTPVVAAYPGYLSRLPEWKSSVIIRIPQDPLEPQRQIWAYYTHMADAQGNSFIAGQFPAGAHEVYVQAGTLLGYQGNYSGNPSNPVGVHLHFSLVRDDGAGQFLNELEIENTLDPSPYLGLPANAQTNQGEAPVCENKG